MVGGFIRSLSLPNALSKPHVTHHIRSVSLPGRSHPLISHLTDEINELRIRTNKSNSVTTSAWLCDGLSRVKEVNDLLDYIIQLPQTQVSLRSHPKWVDNLLEHFLSFVDVYGIFQTLVLSLKEHQLAAQVAIRKRDESGIASYIISIRKTAKEIAKLACRMRSVATHGPVSGLDSVPVDDAELFCIFEDVIKLTALVSAALFRGISLSFLMRKPLAAGPELRIPKKKAKKGEPEVGILMIKEFQQVGEDSLSGLTKKGNEEVRLVLKRMQDFEACLGDLELVGHSVLRSLINTRVLLLNNFMH